jgi:hypothetical protein
MHCEQELMLKVGHGEETIMRKKPHKSMKGRCIFCNFQKMELYGYAAGTGDYITGEIGVNYTIPDNAIVLHFHNLIKVTGTSRHCFVTMGTSERKIGRGELLDKFEEVFCR